MTRQLITATILLAVLQLSVPREAIAWTAETHIEIARQAATIAPPDLFRQIKRNEKAFVAGLTASLAEKKPLHSQTGGELLARVSREAQTTVAAIEGHRRFAEITQLLGRLAISAADANNPLHHSAEDPNEARYGADYERYVSSAYPRFPVLFYGEGRDIRTKASLDDFLAEIRRRGKRYYSYIGSEYQRVGKVDGVEEFDDRSTAFGVGSIAFSHAVSDVAALYRYIWVASGGADRRDLPVTPPEARPAASERTRP